MPLLPKYLIGLREVASVVPLASKSHSTALGVGVDVRENWSVLLAQMVVVGTVNVACGFSRIVSCLQSDDVHPMLSVNVPQTLNTPVLEKLCVCVELLFTVSADPSP